MARSNLAPIASMGYFSGLDNVADPVRTRSFVVKVGSAYKNVYPLIEAMNMEIDNSRGLKSRVGQTEKVTGTTIGSLWSNISGIKCFFVDGDSLYALNYDYSKTAIGTGFAGPPLSYAELNDRIYFTSPVRIGYIKDNTVNSLQSQTIRYKLPLPAGHLIAAYRSRIYVARGNVVYFSDALSDCWDVRRGYRQFSSRINMLRPVEDGIYVSDDQTWFLHGKIPEEMEKVWIDNDAVIPGTDVGNIEGQRIGEDGIDGYVAMWTTKNGICVGSQKGNMKNLTQGRYVLPDARTGSAIFRTTNEVSHYIVNLKG